MAAALIGPVAACAPGGQEADQANAAPEPAAAGYLTAPEPQAVRREPAGLVLVGRAAPGAEVRLATPAGQATLTKADGEGAWQVGLPVATEPRIYGLSMTTAGRRVQAQGYVLVAPDGKAAVLRAGGGSLRLDAAGFGVGAFDFDNGGGAVVSGAAPPGAVVLVRLDGRQAAEGRANAAGRFVIPLAPLGGEAHRLQVYGDGFEDTVTVVTSDAAPLSDGPLRSVPTAGGLRADWLTPGGGVQSTLLTE
jgi:hypothetical protein